MFEKHLAPRVQANLEHLYVLLSRFMQSIHIALALCITLPSDEVCSQQETKM